MSIAASHHELAFAVCVAHGVDLAGKPLPPWKDAAAPLAKVKQRIDGRNEE